MKKIFQSEKFNRIPIIIWGFIIILIVLAVLSPSSVAPIQLLGFTRQAAPMIIVGLGQTMVMMIGGLDLSVASVMIFVNVFAALGMAGNPNNAVPYFILCLAVGVGAGLANGLLSVKLRLPSFIVTLGMSMVFQGLMLILCNGSPSGSIPENVRVLGTGSIGPIPVAFLIWLGVAVVLFVMLKYTVFGSQIKACGVNPMAAYQAGINYQKVQITCYVLCGLLAALAGLQVAAYIGVGTTAYGEDYQMRSIAAAILGGAVFEGGKGSIVGTAVAALFIIVMYAVVAVLNLGAGAQSVIQGVVIFAGLVLNKVRSK